MQTPPIRRDFAVLWLCGLCMRMTVLAIPPVIPMLHRDLALTQTAVGALTSLPVLLLSFAAIPGSFLIARFGAARVLTGGILLAGVGSLLRGFAFDATGLFMATFAMGVGIAVMQPAFPSIVRHWTPRDVGLATATYSNGLLVGEALSASLTIPVVLPLVGGDWRRSLIAWSLPLFAVAAIAIAHARSRERRGHPRPTRANPWWPDWRSPLTWRLGLIAGGCSSVYFGTNAFLPDYLRSQGREDLVGAALSALNWTQIPASLGLLAYPRLMGKRAPLVAAGALSTAAVVGLVALPGTGTVVCSAVLGFCTASVLILSLALPPLWVDGDRVHSVSAAVFAIGYLCAVITPVVGGLAWDLTGVPWAAFVPTGVFGILVLFLSATLEPPPTAHAAAA